MTYYCGYLRDHPEDVLNKDYHDFEYGFPLVEDALLFERLVLEINQAGLSWNTILKKKATFRSAYHEFDIASVANYCDNDRSRLLSNAGIIRNRLKINAAIENAKRIMKIKEDHQSFKHWLDMGIGFTHEEWTHLFMKTFLFTGKEIVKEFLLSTGYLPGAHDVDCPVYLKIQQLNPPWMFLRNN